jgi:ribonuclease BN (tRNA processing enzyme)
MKIRFLGAHNTETLTSRLPGILVDGALMLDAASLTSSLSLEEQLKLKAVLVTHQHYDHLRDLPMLGMNLFLNGGSTGIYGSQATRQALAEHLLNGTMYSRFLERPTFDYYVVEPGQSFCAAGCDITALTVDHSVPALGYEVSAGGRRLFYTGDTGPGLAEVWRRTRPDMLVIEVTAPNRWTDYMRQARHLTPELLRIELESFQEINGYVPRVYTVHMNPALEADITAELKEVSRALDCRITAASEGLEVEV